MTRQQALTRLKKMYGKKGYARVNDGTPTTAQREKAVSELGMLRARRDSLRAALESRRVFLLQNDEEYQTLEAQTKQARQELDDALSVSHRYKFQVGYIDDVIGAFHVRGEGDTWEDAFAKADTR